MKEGKTTEETETKLCCFNENKNNNNVLRYATHTQRKREKEKRREPMEKQRY